jgi:hypothetical protein
LRLEEKHKKTGKTRKNNDGFIMFLGFYFVFLSGRLRILYPLDLLALASDQSGDDD